MVLGPDASSLDLKGPVECVRGPVAGQTHTGLLDNVLGPKFQPRVKNSSPLEGVSGKAAPGHAFSFSFSDRDTR